MSNGHDDITRRLLEVFGIEAREHLQAIAGGLVELENAPAQKRPALLERLFRAAHNFKGASRTVEQSAVEAICQSIESIFATWKDENVEPAPERFDVLHEALNTIETLLSENNSSVHDPRVSRILQRLSRSVSEISTAEPSQDRAEQPPPKTSPQKRHSAGPAGPDPLLGTVRISSDRLDQLLSESEEMLTIRMAIERIGGEMKSLLDQLKSWNDELGNTEHLFRAAGPHAKASLPDMLSDWTEWSRSHITSLQEMVNSSLGHVHETSASFATMVHRHLDHMKTTSLLPFSSLTALLPKNARDLLRQEGKESDIVIQGGDVEIDRRILQELKSPLLHLLRNAIDHGLETPEERKTAGKPPAGRIKVQLSRLDNSKFQVTIADDGSGIDPACVKQSAIQKRIITEKEAQGLSRNETLNLIFNSGVSTQKHVSEISGRGLGMAIVRESVERLSGQIWVESEQGSGTTFRIVLPSTIATLRALRVRLRDRFFMIPTAFVDQVLRCSSNMISSVENRDTIQVKGETLALLDLGALLQLGAAKKNDDMLKHTVILKSADKKVALTVDQIIEEREILAKPMGPQLERVRMVAGGTILGDGEVVPILNISDLLSLETRQQQVGPKSPVQTDIGLRKSILVVEDSITSRTLLKSILESSGFVVKTAFDGAEGFALLKTEQFDLVISDVDMPRMNGFELTRKIRADKDLAELPVILVTALESQKDRELGIDAGASAYIVKSKFDNMSLLQTIRRMV